MVTNLRDSGFVTRRQGRAKQDYIRRKELAMREIEQRVTLKFRSDSGAEYLYDDSTGSILPWSSLYDAMLREDLGSPLTAADHAALLAAPSLERDAAKSCIKRMRKTYGAFIRKAQARLPVPTADEAERLLRFNCMELILIVTESCNLRCKYCVYSEPYIYHRRLTSRRMTVERALQTVDWFVDYMGPALRRHPRKQFGLSFYGGEPLLNMEVIKSVLEHVTRSWPGLFQPVMTTNGVLLTRDKAKVLVDHDVQLAVSIDGPKDEHDRLRIDANGRGTYERIIENLKAIKSEWPEFWATHLTATCVYDLASKIDRTAEFFEEHADVIPRPVFVNQVSNHNTSYYDGCGSGDYDAYNARYLALRERYKQTKIAGDRAGGYLTLLAGFPLIRILLRSRISDVRTPFLPYTGCCIPGTRLAVHPDGKVDMCERVNGTFPIGHLDNGGIHYDRVVELIQEFQERVMQKCGGCPVSRLCSQCFALAECKGGFEEPREFCQNMRRNAARSLKDFVSIMEGNPNVDFDFETDVSAIERRALIIA